MKKVVYAVFLLTIVFISSCTKNENFISVADRRFTVQASLSNTVEVKAGKLASSKASNPEVKKYAERMVLEHQMAQTELKNLSHVLDIVVYDVIDPAHAAMITQLNDMPKGRVFDSIYIHSQVTDHDMTIANFQTEVTNGNNSEVKSYASTYLPHIQKHRQSADSISKAFFRR